MAAPFVATSRLSNIIQMITLSRQTGILRAIRGPGATREMGQIRFIDGEPVAALQGQLTGAAALDTLSNWSECQYAFDELTIAEAQGDRAGPMSSFPGMMSDPTTSPSLPGRYSPTAPVSDVSWPVYGYQQPSGPLADLAALAASGSQGAGSASSYPSSSTSPGAPYMTQTAGYGAGAGMGGQPAIATGVLALVPRRTAVAEQIDQLPLDRRERMVLLLVDGQRTIADLARLTRRTEPELQSVLSHLQGLGLVRIAN